MLTALLAKLDAERLNEDETSTPGGTHACDRDAGYRHGWADRTRTIVEWIREQEAKS